MKVKSDFKKESSRRECVVVGVTLFLLFLVIASSVFVYFNYLKNESAITPLATKNARTLGMTGHAVVSDIDLEGKLINIANSFSIFFESSVSDVLYSAEFNFSDIESAKEQIQDIGARRMKKIWFNEGSDEKPISKTDTIPLYSEISYIDKNGNELIRFNGSSFSDELRDVSKPENTEFKSETYFSDAKNIGKGKVFIGKLMTWYIPSEEVFANNPKEDFGTYEKVVGRDLMKKGVIRLSSPVYEGDEFKGVVVFSIDYRAFAELSKHIDPSSVESLVSTSYAGNYILVFDSDSNTIIHPKPDNIRGYLDDGGLAGYNEPNSTREGAIFNLYRYTKSPAYPEIARSVLGNKTNYFASATDVGGRNKVTMSVPIKLSDSRTNYAESGVFGGIMASIQYTLSEPKIIYEEVGVPVWVYFSGIFLLAFIVFLIISSGRGVKKKGEHLSISVRKFSINDKIVLSFVVLGIFISLVIIAVFYFEIQSYSQEHVGHFLQSVAGSRGEHVNSYVHQTLDMLRIVSSRTTMREVLNEYNKDPSIEKVDDLNSRLIDSADSLTNVKYFSIISLDGKTIASSDKTKLDRIYNSNEFVMKGKFGENIFLMPNEENVPSIFIDGPIFFNDEVIGILLAESSPAELYDSLLSTAGMVGSGETFLVNREGFVLSPLRFSENTFYKLVLNSSNFKGCFESPSDSSGNENSFELIELVGGHGKIEVGTTFYVSRADWCLIAKIDKSEASASFGREFTFYSFIIIIISVSCISLLGFILSRRITEPIMALTSATEEMERGNLDARVDISSGDELEILGEVFNKTVKELKNIDDERKQLDKAKTEFLSVTSHELRSPMTPMRAQLQMLLKNYFGKLSTSQKDSLEIVLRNTERLDRIITDLLEVSRIEAARLRFNFIKIEPEKEIAQVISEMKNFMPEKHIKINFSSKPLPIIEADPDRLAQVIRNLLNNAIKFSESGKSILVSAERMGDFIKISVKDNGIGISVESLGKIFEPFYQGEQTIFRKYAGTGLGLTISRGIIESQGGKIWVESKLGKGSVFYFTIPLKPIREIKPIKLLFSGTYKINNQLREIFKEYLGPIGEHDFDEIEAKGMVKRKDLLEHIDYLVEEKILPQKKAFEFKFKVLSVIEGGVPSSIAANLENFSLREKSALDSLKSISLKFLGSSGEGFFKKNKGRTYYSISEQVDNISAAGGISSARAKEFKDELLALFIGEIAQKGGVEESFAGFFE